MCRDGPIRLQSPPHLVVPRNLPEHVGYAKRHLGGDGHHRCWPVGIFQIFELGLLGISAHIIDSLSTPGGQCTELYPEKPIYDIPALPICGAQELIDRLLEQTKPFAATYHLGHEVTELERLPDGNFWW